MKKDNAVTALLAIVVGAVILGAIVSSPSESENSPPSLLDHIREKEKEKADSVNIAVPKLAPIPRTPDGRLIIPPESSRLDELEEEVQKLRNTVREQETTIEDLEFERLLDRE